MATFARWYLGKLKTHPMLTNMGSAVVLMTAGDFMAQELELHDLLRQDDTTKETTSTSRHVFLRRYGELHPAADDQQLSSSSQQSKSPSWLSNVSELKAAAQAAYETLEKEASQLDPYRAGTMVGWAVGFYTPFYISLYRLYDRWMPQRTPATIMARVGMSFLISIPLNAAFFVYGSVVHQTSELLSGIDVDRQQYSLEGGSMPNYGVMATAVPEFDWHVIWNKAMLKVNTELWTTVLDSGKVWIPINIFNFSVLPPHLRPLSLMVFSVFWNCYLSLAQHRDIALTEGAATL